jgi:hypothetical protein
MTDPWSPLGLEGPASEAEIRRAYARKLKTLDLQGDAAAFQSLVAARGHALELAARGAEESEPGSSMRVAEAVAATADARELTGPFPNPDGFPDARPEAPPHDEVGELSVRSSSLDAPEGARLAEYPATSLAERLGRASQDGWQPGDVDTWNAILRDLALLPIGGAKRLESEVIRAVAAVMLRPEILPPVPWFKRWRRVNRFRRPNRYTDPSFLGTVLEIGSFYGWFLSDQAIAQTLDPPTWERLIVHLQAAKRAHAALTAKRVNTGQEAISSRDAEAIFADADIATLVTLTHEQYLKARRWPRLWQVFLLLLAPLSMPLVHQKRLLVLWAVLFAIVPATFRFPDYPYKQLLLATSLIALGCLHVWMAAYWYRGYIRHGKTLIARADRLHIFHPELRRTFLSGRSPDRFGNPLPPWYGAKRVWGWIRLIFVRHVWNWVRLIFAEHLWRWMCLILPRHVWSTIFFIIMALMFVRTFGILTKLGLSETSAGRPPKVTAESLRRDLIGRPPDPARARREPVRAAPGDRPTPIPRQ